MALGRVFWKHRSRKSIFLKALPSKLGHCFFGPKANLTGLSWGDGCARMAAAVSAEGTFLGCISEQLGWASLGTAVLVPEPVLLAQVLGASYVLHLTKGS